VSGSPSDKPSARNVAKALNQVEGLIRRPGRQVRSAFDCSHKVQTALPLFSAKAGHKRSRDVRVAVLATAVLIRTGADSIRDAYTRKPTQRLFVSLLRSRCHSCGCRDQSAPFGGASWMTSKAKYCRANARECLERANAAEDEGVKRAYWRVAAQWSDMTKRRSRREDRGDLAEQAFRHGRGTNDHSGRASGRADNGSDRTGGIRSC
jgi:hypothetical protein